MYKTVADTVKYVKEFRGMVKDVSDVEIVVAPTFTALHAAAEAARNSNVVIAAQDLYWEREGAFTGQIGAPMIREAGAEYVIVGHLSGGRCLAKRTRPSTARLSPRSPPGSRHRLHR
jgi:triosephosphate isomerase